MGNNNTFLTNDRNPNPDSPLMWPKDVKKAMDEIAIKNIAKYSPYSRRSFMENLSIDGSKTNEPSFDTKGLMIKSDVTRKYSPTQKIFLDNVILPVTNEVNTRIVQKLSQIPNDENEKEVQIRIPEIYQKDETKNKTESTLFGSSPNRSSGQSLTRNIEAMMLEKSDSNVFEMKKKYPAVFQYQGPGKEVYVMGSFNNWKKLKLSKSATSNDFIAILELREGNYEYEYIIEDETKLSLSKKICSKKFSLNGRSPFTNGPKKIMKVQKSDYDVFRALDMDSFDVLRNKRNQNIRRNYQVKSHQTEKMDLDSDDGFTQSVPRYSKRVYMSTAPPIIPPHLLHFMLNKKPIRKVSSEHPELLPKPCHTLLNHLYAMPMKEGVMTLSTTQRYRQKFVTTIMYRPVGDSI